jgi:hypothetical protein
MSQGIPETRVSTSEWKMAAVRPMGLREGSAERTFVQRVRSVSPTVQRLNSANPRRRRHRRRTADKSRGEDKPSNGGAEYKKGTKSESRAESSTASKSPSQRRRGRGGEDEGKGGGMGGGDSASSRLTVRSLRKCGGYLL